MNIFVLPAWYPQNEQDVNGCFVREQAQALAKQGHCVTVLHIEPLSFTRMLRGKMHTKRVWQDGDVRTIFHQTVIPVPGKFASLQDVYLSRLFYRILKEQVEEDVQNGLGAPDVLHGHVSHSCAYYGLLAAEELKLPYVVTEHYSGLLLGTATEREYERVYQTMEKSDAFIFVGTNFQRCLTKRLGVRKKTYVVPNLLDVLACSRERKEKNENFTFLVACHLTKNKSVDHIIRAFHQAFSPEETVRLTIAGDGAERAALETLVQQLGEQKRVTFLGRYEREQVGEIFSSADAFVLTSKVETFGIVYLEAMANGLACIGTKGQGAEDIITKETGIKVEYGNQDELVAALRTLVENRAQYDPDRLKEICVERFSEESVCRQIEDVYRQIGVEEDI